MSGEKAEAAVGGTGAGRRSAAALERRSGTGVPASLKGSPTPCAVGRAFGTAGIPAGAFADRPLVTRHLSLITAFLIYGAAIRIPRKP